MRSQASSAQTPLFLALLSTILAPLTLAAQCTPCQTYAQDLSYVSYNFDTTAASGGGPIRQIDIGAMCLTGAGLNNMIACYSCGYVTGHDLQILEAWILVCNTLKVSGQAAALACWNTDKNQCVVVSGVDTPSALSLSPAATPVATGGSPGTTAGGDGSSDTETVTSTEADASTTATATKSTVTKTSDTVSTAPTSGTTRSASGTSTSTAASSTATPKANSGDGLAQDVLSNAKLALWVAVVGFVL
ncbi:hypothetical protein BR93DRAFT_241022 [Coniochaeta sp. PMI_546]|nr:hypothetical protein BR93DRAFT_241022 [Coniochaeta sp. PMI_546]